MANEVEILIKANYTGGPAFARALADMEMLKRAANGINTDNLSSGVNDAVDKMEKLNDEMKGMTFGKIDTSDMGSSLMAMKAKIQSLGIADIADINITPGRITTQLMLLKRLINQAGISDILDFNVNDSSLRVQLEKIGGMTEHIPVTFDVGNIPTFGPTQNLSEKFGFTIDPDVMNKIRDVDAAMNALGLTMGKVGTETRNLGEDFQGFGAYSDKADSSFNNLADALKNLQERYNAFFAMPAGADIWNSMINGATGSYRVLQFLVGEMQGAAINAAANLGGAYRNLRNASIPSFNDISNAVYFNLLNPMNDLFNLMVGKGRTAFSNFGAYAAYGAGVAGSAFNRLLFAANAAAGGAGGGGGGLFGLAAAGGAAGRGGIVAGRGFGWFGGILGGTIGGVGLWHVALDGIMETLLSVGGAMIAAGAGISVMVKTATDLFTNLTSTNDVSLALGQSLPPLTGQFNALSKAMAPQTIEFYGGALNLVNQKTGAYADAAKTVVNMFDDWIAKLDIWSSKQGGINGLMNASIGFLGQWVHVMASLGGAIDHLVKDDPGTAHFLLDILGAGAKLLDVVSQLPGPIVKIGLGMHSMYVWGSVLGGLLVNMSRGFGLMGGPIKAVGELIVQVAHNPALGLMALGTYELVKAWNAADRSVVANIANINDALNQLSGGSAIAGISGAIGQLNNQINTVSTANVLQQWKGWSSAFNEAGNEVQFLGHNIGMTFNTSVSLGHQLAALGDVFKGIFDPGYLSTGAAMGQATKDVQTYKKAIENLTQSQTYLFQETGYLVKQGYSVSQAWALMDLAGVKSGDNFDLQKQKVNNLITGYKNISVQGGILTNSINAIDFASLQTASDISRVTGGWSAFFGTLTSGESGFVAFSQALQTVSVDSKAAKGNATGLWQSNIALRGSIVSAAQAAQTEYNNLYTLAGAAGLGQKGTDMLTQAGKDMVQMLLPAAKGSKALTDILYGLAQQAGYQGVDSFKALTQWVGKTKDPMQNLDNITTQLTDDSANLIKDVQNLSTALGTTLNNAMAAAIFQATGGQKVFDQFATAVLNNKSNIEKDQGSAYNLANSLYHLTGNVTLAKGEFYAFAEDSLGLTKSQTDYLWQHSLPKLQAAINALHGTTVSVRLAVAGSGVITASGTAADQKISDMIDFKAGGGPIWGAGGPKEDKNLIWASNGEYMIQADAVKKYGYGFLDAINHGKYASGGPINLAGPENWASAISQNWAEKTVLGFGHQSVDYWKQVLQNAVNAGTAGPGSATGATGGGSPSANALLAKMIYPQYTSDPSIWSAWNYVAMRESGWNQYADNPTSGAYGIAQALPYNKMPKAAWPSWAGGSSDPRTQIMWMWDYMASSYGGPIGAAAHEQQYNWYDNGGWLKPGLTMAYNGTGKPERVIGPNDSVPIVFEIGSSGNQTFDQFMLEWIRNNVRVKGGGNVQAAFGRNK
jgi:hypothetical protein